MSPTDSPRNFTARQRYDAYHAVQKITDLEREMRTALGVRMQLPREWHEIAKRRRSPKDRVTIRLDRDVVKFFRGIDPMYGPLINDTLRAFMHAKLSGLLKDEAREFRFEGKGGT